MAVVVVEEEEVAEVAVVVLVAVVEEAEAAEAAAAAARRRCRSFADRAALRGKEAPPFVSHAGRALESNGRFARCVYVSELRWGIHVDSS